MRHVATTPPSPMPAKRSPQSLHTTCSAHSLSWGVLVRQMTCLEVPQPRAAHELSVLASVVHMHLNRDVAATCSLYPVAPDHLRAPTAGHGGEVDAWCRVGRAGRGGAEHVTVQAACELAQLSSRCLLTETGPSDPVLVPGQAVDPNESRGGAAAHRLWLAPVGEAGARRRVPGPRWGAEHGLCRAGGHGHSSGHGSIPRRRKAVAKLAQEDLA